jgi:dihydrodipicolinate synthase/N-acetylneuraminate lyase
MEEFWNSHHQKNLEYVFLERNTPLMLAIQSKSHKVIKWLTTVAKVDVSQSLRLPMTPLDFVVERNDFIAVKFLVDGQAKVTNRSA